MRWMLVLLIVGCVGSPIHSTLRYNSIQGSIADNNQHLLGLRVGMPMDEAQGIMGPPERSEGYPWGTALLYRTAMTSGIYGTADPDFTPVVFDPNGRLMGWGRNFFVEQAQKYDITVKNR